MAKRTIRIGNTGDEVRDLQTALVALGLAPAASITGLFTPFTAKTVLAFQRAHGLVEDGVVGPRTWAAIEAAVPAEMPDWGTAGPDEADGGEFVDGWWSLARRVDAHAGRVGGPIVASTVVVHTTDMAPGTMGTLVAAWKRSAGRGACAHFVLGRTPEDGIVQMIPITRNGNHAGGSKLVDGKLVPWHGDWRIGGRLVHPNRVAVGIELDCAGHLGKRVPGKGWVHRDSGVVIPEPDVHVDAKKVGWHKVTDYQLEMLGRLLDDVGPELAPLPADAQVIPNGTYVENGVPWAAVEGLPRVVGHVTLNPNNKTDPGPQVMAWLAARPQAT